MTDDDPPARAFVTMQVTVTDDDGDVLLQKTTDAAAGFDLELPVNKRLKAAEVSVDVLDVEVRPTDEDGEAVNAPTPQTSTEAREALTGGEDGDQ